ncbi:MAG: 5-formyltetrahydrofolate cyclo-ligase [Ruminococcus sp.]|nr:5-formyltetrahydrofolate cyclo-ligase [Ruminococcus sp.]
MPDNTLKKPLREQFSRIRDNAFTAEKCRKIAERLLHEPTVRNADTVLCYVSFRSEPDTWELIRSLLGAGVRVACPRCGRNREMTFHIIDDTGQLIPGRYGISEPDIMLPQPVLTESTVCIVPGLAFSPDGSRLGYGGGYYDTFLAAAGQVYTIAAAFEEQITDHLPCGEYDIKIRAIATDERMIYCNEQ